MRTPLVILAIAAGALGPAAAAAAKEIASVKASGADGRHDVTDRITMAITDGGPPSSWPDEATPFYRVKIAVTGEQAETVPRWTFLVGARRAEGQVRGRDVGEPAEHHDRRARGDHEQVRAAARLEARAPGGSGAQGDRLARDAHAPAGDGGLPTAIWALIAGLGLVALLARGAASALARRGAPRPPDSCVRGRVGVEPAV